jgi:hypothetical protein
MDLLLNGIGANRNRRPVLHVPDHGNVGRPSIWLELLIDGRMRPQLWHAESHEVRRQEFAVIVVQQN